MDEPGDDFPNAELYLGLMEVSMIYGYLEDEIKERAYYKAANIVLVTEEKITGKNAESFGFTKDMAKHIDEILAGKSIVEKPDHFDVYLKLMKIEGVGGKTAKQWIKDGDTTMKKIKLRKDLTRIQEIGIKYYDDLLMKIPRKNVKIIANSLIKFVGNMVELAEIAGSYRREVKESGDIDIVLAGDNEGITLEKIIDRIVSKTKNTIVLSCGTRKSSLLINAADFIPEKSCMHKVDIIYVSKEEFPTALLYMTGSKFTNIFMRQMAIRKGYRLSDEGLFDKKGKKLKVKNEIDIFILLDLAPIEPKDR